MRVVTLTWDSGGERDRPRVPLPTAEAARRGGATRRRDEAARRGGTTAGAAPAMILSRGWNVYRVPRAPAQPRCTARRTRWVSVRVVHGGSGGQPPGAGSSWAWVCPVVFAGGCALRRGPQATRRSGGPRGRARHAEGARTPGRGGAHAGRWGPARAARARGRVWCTLSPPGSYPPLPGCGDSHGGVVQSLDHRAAADRLHVGCGRAPRPQRAATRRARRGQEPDHGAAGSAHSRSGPGAARRRCRRVPAPLVADAARTPAAPTRWSVPRTTPALSDASSSARRISPP